MTETYMEKNACPLQEQHLLTLLMHSSIHIEIAQQKCKLRPTNLLTELV